MQNESAPKKVYPTPKTCITSISFYLLVGVLPGKLQFISSSLDPIHVEIYTKFVRLISTSKRIFKFSQPGRFNYHTEQVYGKHEC